MAILTSSRPDPLGVPRSPARRLLPALLALLVAALACHASPPSPPKAQLNELEAVFLLNFAVFVNWPNTALHDDGSPLVIGVLGDDPFGEVLDQIVRGEKVSGHPLVVHRFSSARDASHCNILYISSSENDRLGRILGMLENRSILTVGESDDFNERGGIIRFVTEGNHLRLRINLAAADAARLRISSKLLRPAEIFRPGVD